MTSFCRFITPSDGSANPMLDVTLATEIRKLVMSVPMN